MEFRSNHEYFYCMFAAIYLNKLVKYKTIFYTRELFKR